MQKWVSGTLAAILFHVLIPAGLHAQTAERAGEAVLATPLAVCEEKAGEGEISDVIRAYPCEQYIDKNVSDDANTIKYLLKIINDNQRESMNDSYVLYAHDQTVQWILVALAFMITIAAVITKSYPELKIKKVDFAMVPIVLAALSAAVTSINVYYQFGQYMRLNENVWYDLSELKSDIHFAIFRHVEAGKRDDSAKIDEDTINAWHDRLEQIMQRYFQRESGAGS